MAETRPADCTSFGPNSSSRRAASAAVRPFGEDFNRLKVCSTVSVCQIVFGSDSSFVVGQFDHPCPFAHTYDCSTFAQKKKPSARRMSRKRSWSLSFLPYPMRRVPHDGHRVDGRIGPPKEGDLLPFRGPHSTTDVCKSSNCTALCSSRIFLLRVDYYYRNNFDQGGVMINRDKSRLPLLYALALILVFFFAIIYGSRNGIQRASDRHDRVHGWNV